MKGNFEEEQSSRQRDSQTRTPAMVEGEEDSEVWPKAALSTREVQAEAEVHSPRKGIVSPVCCKRHNSEFK